MVKNLPAMQQTRIWSLGQEWQPTPVFLPGEFHGQRSLEGYSLWGLKKSDWVEVLTFYGSESCSVVPDSLRPHGCPWNSPGQNTGVVASLFSRGSSQLGQIQVSHIAGGFFTSWATREAQDTGVGSLSLLQRIFPTQELELGSHALQADSLPTELSGKRGLNTHTHTQIMVHSL